MDDYILRSDAIQCAKDQADDFNNENLFSSAEGALAVAEWLEDVPSADVRPVVRAHWIYHGDNWGDYYQCSNCHYEYMVYEGDMLWKFCPTCGANMRAANDRPYGDEGADCHGSYGTSQ